jgi:hypothetical protein
VVTGVTIRSVDVTVTSDLNGSGTASCNPGEFAIGGGVANPTGNAFNVRTSRPDPATGTDPTGWFGDVRIGTATTWTFTVYALCVAATP